MRLTLCLLASLTTVALANAPPEEPDPPGVALGERLFLDSRFSFGFAAQTRDVNAVVGERATKTHARPGGASIPGTFAGHTMSCRHCHLVDEQPSAPGLVGPRTYADFAPRTPVTQRGDGRHTTLRNSQQMVDIGAFNAGGRTLLHHDGEFATLTDLITGTLTGRNMGWLPAERAIAMRHIASVIRHDAAPLAHLAPDDGKSTFSGTYAAVLNGASPVAPDQGPDYVLPKALRVDVSTASDAEIVAAVARLIGIYIESLEFSRDAAGAHNGSAFDRFLAANGLPTQPATNQSAAAYTDQLRARLADLKDPQWIAPAPLELHQRASGFGPTEFAGLRRFLSPEANCTACHPLPEFSDFKFHNTGATQLEYDALHGAGRFAQLEIPDLATRNAHPDAWLPATPAHPSRPGPLFRVPVKDNPRHTDLGVWNSAFRPTALAHVDARLRVQHPGATDAQRLDAAIAAFRTPLLRDLGQSDPYFHNGAAPDLAAVIAQYVQVAALARAKQLRNPDPELLKMRIDANDIDPLVAFLRALDEDYN